MNYKVYGLTLLFVCILFTINLVEASVGDHLSYFRKCLTNCLSSNCSSQHKLLQFWEQQPFYLNITQWSCEEECKYQCQWSTIDFLINDLELERNLLPQFHGKVYFYIIYVYFSYNLVSVS